MKKIFMFIIALCMGVAYTSAQVDSVVVNGNGTYTQYVDTLLAPVDSTICLDTIATVYDTTVTYDTINGVVDTITAFDTTFVVDTNYTAFDTMYLNMLAATPDSGWRFGYMVIVSFDSIEYYDTIFSNTVCIDWFGMVEYVIINFDPITGIGNATNNGSVKVYPNPTNSHVTIDADNYRNSTVYTVNGSTVTTTTSKRVDMTNMPAGTYVIQVRLNDNTVLTYKVVKK